MLVTFVDVNGETFTERVTHVDENEETGVVTITSGDGLGAAHREARDRIMEHSARMLESCDLCNTQPEQSRPENRLLPLRLEDT
jgi:hypothetical protein